MDMLRVQNLKKYFDTSKGKLKAVDGISFDIAPNTILGLVGESGSGKSTLGKLIAGLHDKTDGKANWNNQEMPKHFRKSDFLKFSKDIQMIFQDPFSALNPRMQLWQLLEEPCLLANNPRYLQLSKDERIDFLQSWLKKVGLRAGYYNRYPHEFSGGQQQRIGIARALINKPKLLICDEPISALDVSVQAQVVNLLKSLQEELDMSLLFIAHDLAMVNYLCDEVAVMYLGKIVEQGETKNIFSNPKHPYTQLLLASNPAAPVTYSGKNNKEATQKEIPKAQGEIPSPINLPENACGFVSRCPRRSEQCYSETPVLQEVKNRKVACFNI